MHVIEPTGVDIAVEFLNWRLITGLLLIVGLTGLYMEAMAPGHGVGGLVAAACFLLLFWSHFLGGTADWLEVLLFILGLACIAVEIFLLPGTIVPGLAGAALILVSLVMASQGFLIPETARQLHTLAGTMAMIVISCSVFVAAAVVLTRRMDSLPLLNRLMLAPPDAESATGKSSAASGQSRTRGRRLGRGPHALATRGQRPLRRADDRRACQRRFSRSRHANTRGSRDRQSGARGSRRGCRPADLIGTVAALGANSSWWAGGAATRYAGALRS